MWRRGARGVGGAGGEDLIGPATEQQLTRVASCAHRVTPTPRRSGVKNVRLCYVMFSDYLQCSDGESSKPGDGASGHLRATTPPPNASAKGRPVSACECLEQGEWMGGGGPVDT